MIIVAEEFLVLAGMQARETSPTTSKKNVRKGSGATANAEVELAMLDAQFFRVQAESTEEAILHIRKVFPGQTNDKMFAVKASSGEEK